jgi:hypothetical protein
LESDPRRALILSAFALLAHLALLSSCASLRPQALAPVKYAWRPEPDRAYLLAGSLKGGMSGFESTAFFVNIASGKSYKVRYWKGSGDYLVQVPPGEYRLSSIRVFFPEFLDPFDINPSDEALLHFKAIPGELRFLGDLSLELFIKGSPYPELLSTETKVYGLNSTTTTTGHFTVSDSFSLEAAFDLGPAAAGVARPDPGYRYFAGLKVRPASDAPPDSGRISYTVGGYLEKGKERQLLLRRGPSLESLQPAPHPLGGEGSER